METQTITAGDVGQVQLSEVDKLDAELLKLGNMKSTVVEQMRGLRRRRDILAAQQAAKDKVAAMSDVERAALAQAIVAHSSVANPAA